MKLSKTGHGVKQGIQRPQNVPISLHGHTMIQNIHTYKHEHISKIVYP